MSTPDDLSRLFRQELQKHLEDLRDLRSEIPSVALIYPLDQHYLKSGFVGQKWVLRLCCMYPGGEHTLESPGAHKEGETDPAIGTYYLEDLGDLTRPIIKWMSSKAKIVKALFPRLGGFFEWTEKNEVTSFLKSAGGEAKDISLPKSPLPQGGKYLPIPSEYITLAGLDDREYREIEGQGLIFLQQVIQQHGRCGNLRLFITGEGRVLWLCREHEALMEAERGAAALADLGNVISLETDMRNSPMSYHNFDLHFSLERSFTTGLQCVARAINPDVGEATERFSLPFTEPEFENLILYLRPSSGYRSESIEYAAKEIGGRLYKAVFQGEVGLLLESCIQLASKSGTKVRIRLHLDSASGLASLPWESLYDESRHGFLSMSKETTLVRYPVQPHPLKALSITPPLKVLVMISSPKDLPLLGAEAKRQGLQQAFSMLPSGLINVHLLAGASLDELYYQLNQDQYHIFHYIGHSLFDDATGTSSFALVGKDGTLQIENERIGYLLRNYSPLRMVILEGVRATAHDVYSSTHIAQTLIRHGIPAVIGMQFEISNEAAIAFSRRFYDAIASGKPVDESLDEARLAIYAVQKGGVEWAAPSLYLLSQDGNIFKVKTPSPQFARREMPMIQGATGLNVSELVRNVLASSENLFPSRLELELTHLIRPYRGPVGAADNPYFRLFSTYTGRLAASLVGKESLALDAISLLSLEIVFEHLRSWPEIARDSLRVLAVPGMPTERPTLLILDPAISYVSQSRRITDQVDLDPKALVSAFERLRPHLASGIDERLAAELDQMLDSTTVNAVIEMLWISRPEVVLTRRPEMVKLCVAAPHLEINCGAGLSTVGVFCRDPAGTLGVTACFHGTGPVGTEVIVGNVRGSVKLASELQDTVFIPLPDGYPVPPLWARGGVRNNPAPSEAEAVWFNGAGAQKKVATRVTSHDAGILRRSKGLQRKVQTPADTNSGDSGCALVDANDRVIGFASERTGIGDFPEMTDWIWADNALFVLSLEAI